MTEQRKPSLQKQQEDEFRETYRQIAGRQPMVEPTEAEKRNGWTNETLTAYLNEQDAAASLKTDPNSALRRAARQPKRANGVWNGHYRPLRLRTHRRPI